MVSATTAAKSFGALASRVREEQVVYTVERDGIPVVEVRPAAARHCTLSDLAAFFASRPPADAAYLKAVEDGIAHFNRPAAVEDPWSR